MKDHLVTHSPPGDTAPSATDPDPFGVLHGVRDAVGEAVIAIAVQRNQITAQRVISETCTNINILARIAANTYGTETDQARVNEAVGTLINMLRSIETPARRREH